jgi:hypothetical protein
MMLLHLIAGTTSSHTSRDTVTVQTATVTDQITITSGSAAAAASVHFNADSTVDYVRANIGTTSNVYNWLVPSDNAAVYVVRATVQSGPTNGGSATGDTTGTWHALTSDRDFGCTLTTTDGASELELLVELSKDGGSSVAASGTVTLRADVVNLGF